jgi:two-component system, OmpR family, alkaline phosphatase synthesis response regulator PhoP
MGPVAATARRSQSIHAPSDARWRVAAPTPAAGPSAPAAGVGLSASGVSFTTPRPENKPVTQRILVVDDDRQIARLVSAYLEQAGFQVRVAYDGEAALHAIRRERPDLVVLDLMLPGREGREVTRIVRADPELATLPIVMLTARVEDVDKIVGLEIGADDYITKPFNPAEVVARVRAVLRRAGGVPATPSVLQVGGLVLDLDRHVVTVDGAPVDLTPTEFALLERLMRHPGRAFSRLDLMEGGAYADEAMARTVDSHVKNLRRKVEPDPSEPRYIQTVYGVGYRLEAPA